MAIKSVKSASGKLYFKCNVQVVKNEHNNLGLKEQPSESQEYTFDPRNVCGYFATEYKDCDGFKQTHLEFYSGHEQVIDCTVKEFEGLFLQL